MRKIYHIHGRAPLYTNTFLLITDAGRAVAIDPDAPAAEYKKLLEKENATLTHILLTHGHHDHIGAVEELRALGARVYLHEADEALYPDAAHALPIIGPQNAALYHQTEKGYGFTADKHYTDGETIPVDELEFTVLFTPGHTTGSVCLWCGDLLFSGDTLFHGDAGRTDLPGGSAEAMAQSLAKLKNLIPDDVTVFPGHEDFTTMGEEKQHNYALRGC